MATCAGHWGRFSWKILLTFCLLLDLSSFQLAEAKAGVFHNAVLTSAHSPPPRSPPKSTKKPPPPPPPAYVPGGPVSPLTPDMCLDKIDNGRFVEFVKHPDGSNRAFLVSQNGTIFLASLPTEGQANFRSVSVFLDITSRTLNNGERGLMGLAFHPGYLSNGRFFVSYICDSSKNPDCQGPCMCDQDTGCSIPYPDPNLSYLYQPTCTNNTIIAEYSAGSNPRAATKASAVEVRRIFNEGRPFSNHNAGQLLFQVANPSSALYFFTGDGGPEGDPFNMAQNPQALLGKVLRFDVDNLQASAWGNYGIPPSNPFLNVPGVRPEIYALGLRNPWGCAFDKHLDSLICADVGQETAEEINVILSGRNYGWRIFEGTYNFTEVNLKTLKRPQPGGVTPIASVVGTLQGPTIQYIHKKDTPTGSACVIGGLVYYGSSVPCYRGKYLYNDFYGIMWIAKDVTPSGQPKWTRMQTKKVGFYCSKKSPLPCGFTKSNLSLMWKWGADNRGEAYVLTFSGVYRVTKQSRCAIKGCT